MRHARAFSISPLVIVLALLSMGLGYLRLQSLPTPPGSAAYARGNAIGFVAGPVIMGGLLGLGAFAIFRRSDRAFNVTLGTFLGLSVLSHTAFMIFGNSATQPAAAGASGPGAAGSPGTRPPLAQRNPAANQPVSRPRPGAVTTPDQSMPPAATPSTAPQISPPSPDSPGATRTPANPLSPRPDSRKLTDVAKWAARGADAAQAPLTAYANELLDQLTQATNLGEAAHKALAAAPSASKGALVKRREQGGDAAMALEKAAKRLRNVIDDGRETLKEAGIDHQSSAAISISFNIEGRAMELAFAAEALAKYLRAIGERDGVLHDNLGKWTSGPGGNLTSKDRNVQFQIDSAQGKARVFSNRAERALEELLAATK